MAKSKPTAPSFNELLTLSEAEDALRCSRRKIYHLARQGRLRLVKFGHDTRITATSLQQLISEIASSPAIGKGKT